MTFREIVGLLLCCIAAALIPIGLYANRGLWWVAFLIAVAGAALFYTERVHKKHKELDGQPSNEPVRPSVPGDIHNYSGWRSGGRRSELESDSSSNEVGD